MKNVEELVDKAQRLRERGMGVGQIADELNVSKDTATWLLTRSKEQVEKTAAVPKDIYIDWSNVGRSSLRLRPISSAMTDMIMETTMENGTEVDVVVGIAISGVPLACFIADDLGSEIAIFHPRKQRWEDGESEITGSMSHNFADVRGKQCVIVDDVITSGTTVTEAVQMLKEAGGDPVSVAVMIDKQGLDEADGVPVESLIHLTRVD